MSLRRSNSVPNMRFFESKEPVHEKPLHILMRDKKTRKFIEQKKETPEQYMSLIDNLFKKVTKSEITAFKLDLLDIIADLCTEGLEKYPRMQYLITAFKQADKMINRIVSSAPPSPSSPRPI